MRREALVMGPERREHAGAQPTMRSRPHARTPIGGGNPAAQRRARGDWRRDFWHAEAEARESSASPRLRTRPLARQRAGGRRD